MTDDTHTHAGGETHEHDGAVPGHTHDATAPEATAAAPVAVDAGPPAGGLALRIALTILGAALMIIGAFLPWAFDDSGTSVDLAAFYSTEVGTEAQLLTSAGAVFILLALLALVGLAFETGWLTRLAGALGIVGWVLILITLFRLRGLGVPEAGIAAVQIGLWLILLGSVVALIGGFFGSRRVVGTRY